jgi:L-threonylcarbamoyladenylate synthase
MPRTRVLQVDPVDPSSAAIVEAARVLRHGGLVAFPTETVYGLGADALNPRAVEAVFAAKERPAQDPLIVHLADAAALGVVANPVPARARRLARRRWPGPLTLVLPRTGVVPAEVTAGLATVAVRVPDHPVARALIRTAGVPVAAPSANRFGQASPTTAAHVLADLDGRVDLVLDAGPTRVGVESTVVDVTGPARILRPGGLSREALEATLGGPVPLSSGPRPAEEAQPSPGLLGSHYAVGCRLVLLSADGPGPATVGTVALVAVARAREETAAGHRVALLLADEDLAEIGDRLDTAWTIASLGPLLEPEVAAAGLFSALRRLEQEGVDVIVARGPGGTGLGLAVADRLRRAATEVLTLT